MLATLPNTISQVFKIEEALKKLFEKLQPLIHGEQSKTVSDGILRIEVPITETDPLIWLQSQDVSGKNFWSDREQKKRFGGIGETMFLQEEDGNYIELILKRVIRILENSSDGVRFYGGMRFNPNITPASDWKDWASIRFILPEIELSWNQGFSTLACNLRLSEIRDQSKIEAFRKRLFGLKKPKIPNNSIFQYLNRQLMPEYEEWSIAVEKALRQISSERLEKVVLARVAEFELAELYDPFDLLNVLKKHAPHAYHYCFQHFENQAFLGISPECLYRRSARSIKTEALASTRPRGRTSAIDEYMAKELKSSEKEIREHQMVLDRIEQVMKNFCVKTSRNSFHELLQLHHVQHLQSRIEGQLQPEINEAHLLPAFHPTPAVCGTPDEEARDLIGHLEPFDRGWYSGPVGWISKNESEFAVAIRSGLLHGKKLKVFTGAGIVHGSNPESEWNEINAKLRSWESILESL